MCLPIYNVGRIRCMADGVCLTNTNLPANERACNFQFDNLLWNLSRILLNNTPFLIAKSIFEPWSISGFSTILMLNTYRARNSGWELLVNNIDLAK